MIDKNDMISMNIDKGRYSVINLCDSEKINELLSNDLINIYRNMGENSKALDEGWNTIIALLRLIQFRECEDEALWIEFREEILHKNRYFPQSKILEKIKELSSIATTEFKEGVILYRCREYTTHDFFSNWFVIMCMDFIKKEMPELSIEENDFQNYSILSTILTGLAWKPGIKERIKTQYKKVVDESDSFWGFKAEENDAPPANNTKSMRVNPEGISYLYAAEDIDTALIEMRPQYGQTYSVASIEITNTVKLFDFTNETKRNVNEEDKYVFSRTVLDKMCSDRNYGNPLDYIPTQFICEYIKLQGFDGIIFHSSLSQGGKNVVLFATDDLNKKYKIIGTDVYGINNIILDRTRILPLDDNFMN